MAPGVSTSPAAFTPGTGSDARAQTPSGSTVNVGPLTLGQEFGSRYRILKALGAGGMGAVYQAWDEELGVAVALKVIRPEALADPVAAQEVERRFKRELLLARQVTHRNVVRIHDMGEVEGIKYLTMPYIQGDDVANILKREGRLPIDRTLGIAKQVASGLAAAHEVGVVHRDLKPENIMIDADGTAIIMDFGIARSVSGTGTATQLGAVMGTLEYMAPEQAQGQPVDHRADIYAFGLILYDLIGGRWRASQHENPMSELMARMTQPLPPIKVVAPEATPAIDAIITRCLQPDPADRYQTTAELAADLDALDAYGHPLAGKRISKDTAAARVRVAGVALSAVSWRWLATALVVLLVGAGGLVLRERTARRSAESAAVSGQPVSLAILPFRNASGDSSLDWLGASFAEMLRTEVGQSARFRTVSSDRLHQILRDLRIPADASFDPPTLRRLAELGNSETVLWGQYVKFGNEIRFDATLEDIKRQRAVPLKASAVNEAALLAAIAQLVQAIREHLAFTPDVVKELQASSFKPSSSSFQALRYYSEGLALARQGKHSEALKKFEASTQEDQNFALAYSKLAQTHASLGYDEEAQRFSRKAAELSEALLPRERYLIQANHARIVNDTKQAIAAYENLLKASPDDEQVQFELARLYEDSGALDPARELYGKIVERDANYMDALLALGRVEIRRRNPQGSLDYLNRALSLAIQLDSQEAKANILNAIGIAYKRLDKPAEALRYYAESLDIKRRLGQKGGIANTLNEIAQVQLRLGKPDEALKAYQEALKLRREIGDTRGIGNNLLDLGVFHADLGQYDQALNLYKESLQIWREVGNQNYEALTLNNIGNAYLLKGQYEDALVYFERTLQLREKSKVPAETALVLQNLAATSARLGKYDEALGHHLRALELWRSAGDKRQAAVEAYRMGEVFEYQGRFGAALKSRGEALSAMRELQERSNYLAEVMSGYGSALSQAGRFDEAAKTLDEALKLAREIRQQGTEALTLNLQGTNHLLRGEVARARDLFEQALRIATTLKDRHLTLVSKANIAKADVRERRARARALRALAEDAEGAGLKFVATDCSIYLGELLLGNRDYAAARQELERSLGRAERLGAKILAARAHYLLALALRGAGKEADAGRHQRQALSILDEARKELGGESLGNRADLGDIARQATF